MVLNQALVLRDISMQVRSRFPTLETLVATGLVTTDELAQIHEVDDACKFFSIFCDLIEKFFQIHDTGKCFSGSGFGSKENIILQITILVLVL